jgi:predicted Zn-dependent protease
VGIAAGAATGATGTNWYDLAYAINSALVMSLFSFSRELESEADAYGIKLMSDAGYTPHAASQVWKQTIEERRASALARKKRYRDHSASNFSTHPPNEARMADLAESAEYLERRGGGPYADRRAEWLATTNGIRPMLLEEQIKLNDPGASHYLLGSLAQDGWDSTLRYFEGEAFRLRDEPGDADRAAQAYAAAVGFPEVYPEAHRAHGYSLLKAGNREQGRAALQRYLELRPDAADAPMVQFSLAQ